MTAVSKAYGTAPPALDWTLLPLEAEASDPDLEVPPADEDLWELEGEAGSGILDGDNAWMADVPGEVLFDYLDRLDKAQPPDVLLGILPRRLGNGAGFDAGGVADHLQPGPTLAGLTADEWETGLGRLSDDEVVGVLLAWRRLNSWTVAGETAAVAELDRRRNAQVAAGADPHLAEHVGDELAVALTLTARSADSLLEFATGLARLPQVARALRTGQIDRPKALVIVNEVACLDDSHATAVAATVIGRAHELTTGQLGRATRNAVLAVDPDAARRQREKARKDARVEVWDEHAGTAALAGRDLPPAEVLAADRRIDTLARHLKAAGHDGTLDQLRAKVYTALLLGQPLDEAASPACGPPTDQPVPAPAPGQAPAVREPAAPAAPPGPSARAGQPTAAPPPLERVPPAAPGADSIPPGLRRTASPAPVPTLGGSVNLTTPLATWLGAAEAPGEAAGFGPLPADDARSLADLLSRQPGTRWCITLTDEQGRPVAHGCAFARHAPRTGVQPAASLSSPSCSEPADGESDEGESDEGRTDGWELTVTIRPLAVGHCYHRRECHTYQPSPGLRHIINIRKRTCSFPGCRRPAVRCDHDHTIPYDKGGKSCECNLAALCRRHHKAKQAQGWHLDQPEPGVLIWRAPHGRRYQVEPDRYPGHHPAEAGFLTHPAGSNTGEARSPTQAVDVQLTAPSSASSRPGSGEARPRSGEADLNPGQARPPP